MNCTKKIWAIKPEKHRVETEMDVANKGPVWKGSILCDSSSITLCKRQSFWDTKIHGCQGLVGEKEMNRWMMSPLGQWKQWVWYCTGDYVPLHMYMNAYGKCI